MKAGLSGLFHQSPHDATSSSLVLAACESRAAAALPELSEVMDLDAVQDLRRKRPSAWKRPEELLTLQQ